MKMTGKIISFDGYVGKIIGLDKQEYLFFKHELLVEVKQGDIVLFEAEIFNDLELKKNVARFITVIKE